MTSAPTASKIAAKEEIVTDENYLDHRKRGHEATVNGTQQDESESSSTEPEAIGKSVVAFSSGNLLAKQVKRLRSKNKKAKK